MSCQIQNCTSSEKCVTTDPRTALHSSGNDTLLHQDGRSHLYLAVVDQRRRRAANYSAVILLWAMKDSNFQPPD